MSSLQIKMDAIIEEMKALPSMIVAFSGGVDSSVVAALAFKALGEDALAVTAVSETLASQELIEAKEISQEIGIRHQLIAFSELDDENFRANTPSRCFFCQTMRFGQLRAMAAKLGCEVVASGSNASDLGDHRPGLKAMANQKIYQPLLTHDVNKQEVRDMALAMGLSVWDKPAKACLSSRIPYGTEVTHDRLRRVEHAENVLISLGFRQFRVRDHNNHARVEIATDEMNKALDPQILRTLSTKIKACGFTQVSLDMIGYRAGSLNPVRNVVQAG